MLKTMLTLGVISFMTMGIPSLVCGGSVENDQGNTGQERKQNLHLKTDNALDLLPLLGKNLKNLNIPQEAIEYIGSSPFLVYYDTNFLGAPCMSATLSFRHDFDTKADYVNDITLSLKEPNFNICRDYLNQELGLCHSCGSLPYAAVNGGAVTYYTYYKDGRKYHLSMASARNYYSLQISLGEPKGAPSRQFTGLALLANNDMTNNLNAAAPTANKDTWFCTECGRANKGKFCGECGTPRSK